MKIATRHFGEVEVDDKAVITMPEGMVGFESIKRYTLLHNPDEEPFRWLQCIDEADVAFVLLDPLLVDPDYDFEVGDDMIELLHIADPGDISLFVIVTVRNDMSKMTANMLAPVLLNNVERLAGQMILHDSDYSTRQPLFTGQGKESEGA